MASKRKPARRKARKCGCPRALECCRYQVNDRASDCCVCHRHESRPNGGSLVCLECGAVREVLSKGGKRGN